MFFPLFIYIFLGLSCPNNTTNITNSDGTETPGDTNSDGDHTSGDNGQLPPPKIIVPAAP
jgi:hypothetical protein